MMLRNTCKRFYSNLKSKDDELKNRDLLQRLKKITVVHKTKKEEKTEEAKSVNEVDDKPLTLSKVYDMVELHGNDPLIWNPSVLARIYRIPEEQCASLVNYVKPFIFFRNEETKLEREMTEYSTVIDLNRLKTDKGYMWDIQKLQFIDSPTATGPVVLEEGLDAPTMS